MSTRGSADHGLLTLIAPIATAAAKPELLRVRYRRGTPLTSQRLRWLAAGLLKASSEADAEGRHRVCGRNLLQRSQCHRRVGVSGPHGTCSCDYRAVTRILDLTPDELLTTTRSVRRRLDFDRPVELDVVRDCLRIALQAPTGSHKQGWRWIVITDPGQRGRIAELYRRAFDDYQRSAVDPGGLFAAEADRSDVQGRIAGSIAYLAENLHRAPVLLLACIERTGNAVLPDENQATLWGSLLPAVWSYMLAARARGLGTAWTDLHLRYEHEVSEVLGLPENVMQGPLIPTAHSIGVDFKPASRVPLENIVHLDRW